MEFYNPLVMSKVFWATEAAELNPFNTDGFLFIDGMCATVAVSQNGF